MKPLTTLGDALAAKGGDIDWRAQLREAGVERRPKPEPPPAPSSRPPSLLVPLTDILSEKEREEEEELARLEMEEKLERERDERNRATIAAMKGEDKPTPFNQNRPDRGYVDQSPPPDPPPVRRRVFVNSESARGNTGVALIRPNVSPAPAFQDGPPRPPSDRETRVFPPPERSSVAAAFRLLTPVPPAPPEPEPEMPQKKSRRSYDEAYKEQIARRVLFSTRPGEQARVAKELDLSQGVVSQWTIRYKKAHPNWEAERNGAALTSPPSQPQSRAQPVTLATPSSPRPLPQLQVKIEGLDEYIEALVDARVTLAVGKAFQRFAAFGGNFNG